MSERELAERLGVSRTALRAAITQLVSTHVLESGKRIDSEDITDNYWRFISAEPVESPDRISCTPV